MSRMPVPGVGGQPFCTIQHSQAPLPSEGMKNVDNGYHVNQLMRRPKLRILPMSHNSKIAPAICVTSYVLTVQ